jgi:hypothetical protein
MSDPGDGRFHTYTGEHMVLRPEPAIVRKMMRDAGIDLDTVRYKITKIYARPRGVGFDFYTDEYKKLLAILEKLTAGEPERPAQIAARELKNEQEEMEARLNAMVAPPRQKAKASTFKYDDPSTVSGWTMAFFSDGKSFRQRNAVGSALHITLNQSGSCNVHIDSRGFVGQCGYDQTRMLDHGYFDLAPHFLPGAFVAIGDRGAAGLYVGPMKGLDGQTRTVIGIKGEW